MKRFIPLLLVPFVFYGCAKEDSANVNQDSIYAIYELFFNETEDKTTARATFRFGGPTGTLLELSDPAGVTFNGKALGYNALTGVHKDEYVGQVSDGSFSYTNTDGQVFMNQTDTIKSIGFPAVDTIDASMAYSFIWQGDPVAQNELVSLSIDGTQQANLEIFSTLIPGKTDLVLAADRLQKVGEGMATVYLKREKNRLSIEDGTSKGGRKAVWYIVEKQIYIDQP